MQPGEKRRLCRVGAVCAGLAAAGLVYAYVLIPRGFVVPCLYRRLTGRRCPGCGVTTLCLALLHGDPAGAWAANRGLFAALPALAVLLLAALYNYVRGSRARAWVKRLETGLSVALVVYLVLWGIVRNQMGI